MLCFDVTRCLALNEHRRDEPPFENGRRVPPAFLTHQEIQSRSGLQDTAQLLPTSERVSRDLHGSEALQTDARLPGQRADEAGGQGPPGKARLYSQDR